MEKYKYVILGAGPAGLTCGNMLSKLGENDFIILEKEEVAGGLCRSVELDGAPLDIGGGHFLDVRDSDVTDFLFGFMDKSEWNLFKRNSQIDLGNFRITHPFESNIWQMPQEEQIKYLKSIAIAGSNIGSEMPEKFVDWIRWKLGDLIANEYMLPYNQKMFGSELDELGTYWLEKLPNVSFDETLLSCINKKPYGTQPGHAQFYYPKRYGYGEVWRRMAESINTHILYNKEVVSIDYNKKEIETNDCQILKAENFIVTIPWNSIKNHYGIEFEIEKIIKSLKYTSVNISYIPDDLETNAQWIYYPNLNLPYHRILVRKNFYNNSKGYWTETNSSRSKKSNYFTYRNEYAYPLNTIYKRENMKVLLEWMKKRNIYGLGRWGEWEHYNSDVTVKRAMLLADSLKKLK